MLKLKFTDFWPGFVPEESLFFLYMSELTDVELSDKPDILFFSLFGYEHLDYSCKKVFFSGENVRPNFNYCDYAMSFDYLDNERHYRYPLYALYDDPNKLLVEKEPEIILKAKTKFCNFVYSNPVNKRRNDFYKLLSKYKKIDSGGRVYNNLDYRIQNKREFISDYKFTIAIENGYYSGYTTEKIFEPMLENSLPIYMGNELVYKDFNTKSFLNYHDYNNVDEFIERIIEVDRNDELYYSYLGEPYFNNNEVNEFIKKENVLSFFNKVINDEINIISSLTNKLKLEYKFNYNYTFIKNKLERFSIDKLKFINKKY